MAEAARHEPHYSAATFFALVESGSIRPDDRVELLEGVIVAMTPQNPPHAATTSRLDRVLREAVGRRAAIRTQLPLVVAPHSVPEPDVAVVPGTESDYDHAHPTTALLVVEVADTSLLQDRLTKNGIYAVAAIPEYWIVNLRDNCVEVHSSPDPAARRYLATATAGRGERIEIVALSGASVAVDDILPAPPE